MVKVGFKEEKSVNVRVLNDSKARSRVYFDIEIDKRPEGRIIFELVSFRCTLLLHAHIPRLSSLQIDLRKLTDNSMTMVSAWRKNSFSCGPNFWL